MYHGARVEPNRWRAIIPDRTGVCYLADDPGFTGALMNARTIESRHSVQDPTGERGGGQDRPGGAVNPGFGFVVGGEQ
jgi:hypothetical protein